ncbi:hypothetical protein BY996DRAFT_8412146 [Phakopsora pachyrhizi]|nr:hypothetical protein BY996DRAFT_8412146 [Phakopsora pachyrhizi]
MLDLSEDPKEENIEICCKYLKQMVKLDLWLEMEIGITGGKEDGVNNENVDDASLYTQPEDIWEIYEAFNKISPMFSIAAAFVCNNLSAIDPLGLILVYYVLLREVIAVALKFGVVKMNVDTDTQWAYMVGFRACLDAGGLLDFNPQTSWIREDLTWKAASPAPGLRDCRVEITGPVDCKMVINASNSGAATYMANFKGLYTTLEKSFHKCSKTG